MASARRSGSGSSCRRRSPSAEPTAGAREESEVMKRGMALGAVLLAVAGGTAIGHKAAAGGKVAAKQGDGGLSLMPATIEVKNAQPGALAEVTVANRSA